MAYCDYKYASRRVTSGQNLSIEVGFIIVAAGDENEAITALKNFAPETWTVDGVELSRANIASGGAEVDEIADTIYDGKMTYGSGTAPELSISFDTSGGRAKITQSLSTTIFPASGLTAPDFRGAIGVTKSGIEGVETPEPALSFTIKRTLPAGVVTPSYVKSLADLTGHYNNDTFATFPAGEVRFDGAQGDQKAPGAAVEASFKFTCSANVTNLTVAGIEGINKLGWQYLWVLYEESEDSAAHFLVQRAIAVYIEDLPNCQPKNFALLGIGV